MINGIINSTGVGQAKIDSATGSISLGTDAGTDFSSDDDNNIAIGVNALNSTGINADNNIAIGQDALTAVDVGDRNIALGQYAGNNITSGTNNFCVGYLSDVKNSGSYQIAIGYQAIAQNDEETRIGNHGAFQFMTDLGTADLASADDNDVADTAPVFKIPAYSVIKSVSCVVTQLSNLGTYKLALFIADDSSRADDQGLTNGVEVLGAGVANTRSSTTAFSGTSMDIDAGSGATLNKAYYSEPDIVLDSGAGASTDRYLWVVNAGTGNGDTDPGTVARLRICVEFVGQD